ncbi:MAG: ribosomal protein S18-alanine N-acetyltransferase [Chloroflexi bacterium]|nr:ribosomal protein S18-alanine N-acetyltransferase [Chloroflexota bacterium]
MSVEVRRMTLEDLPAVVELDALSFSLPWSERSFRFELTDNPVSRCWVAVAEEKIVGMIVAWLLADEAHIATLAIHPAYRRQGIARNLLTCALRQMSKEGAVGSFLEVREGNLPAQELYRQFGYQVVGRRKRYYKDTNEDAILMVLSTLDRFKT